MRRDFGHSPLRQQTREEPSADDLNSRRTPHKRNRPRQVGRVRNGTTGCCRAQPAPQAPEVSRSTGKPGSGRHPPREREPQVHCSTSRRRVGCWKIFPSCSRSVPADVRPPTRQSHNGWRQPAKPSPALPQRAGEDDGKTPSLFCTVEHLRAFCKCRSRRPSAQIKRSIDNDAVVIARSFEILGDPGVEDDLPTEAALGCGMHEMDAVGFAHGHPDM